MQHVCTIPKHTRAHHPLDGLHARRTLCQLLAAIAIVCYPVGLLLVNAMLLFKARRAIISNQPTRLSLAIRFLYAEYSPSTYW